MKLILISADGYGAGKTTLAKNLSPLRFSLADALRQELSEQLPGVDWYNKSQAYKDSIVPGTNKSVRTWLIDWGFNRRQEDPEYWCKKVCEELEAYNSDHTVTIDDIRYLNELAYFKEQGGAEVTHIHIESSTAVHEPQFENEELKKRADYILRWGVE